MADMTLEELRTWIAGSNDFDGIHQRAEACVTAAIKQREQDAKNAARLNYLERSYAGIGRLHWGHADDLPGGLHAAIDAAMAKESGNG